LLLSLPDDFIAFFFFVIIIDKYVKYINKCIIGIILSIINILY
jgi:hypothetical protein